MRLKLFASGTVFLAVIMGAEEIAPLRFARVGVSAGVHETGLAEDRTLQAEQVGMPMAAAYRTSDRTNVHDGLVGVGLMRVGLVIERHFARWRN